MASKGTTNKQPTNGAANINFDVFGRQGSDNRLTPDNAALVLIDYQTGLLLGVQTIEQQALRSNVVALAKTAKIFRLPTLLTGGGTEDSTLGPDIPDLTEILTDATFIKRTTINIFDMPEAIEWLRKTNRPKLIMAGITTDLCLEQAALPAKHACFDVYVSVDASATWTKQLEEASLIRMAQEGIHLTNWLTISSELQYDWQLPTGKDVQALYAERLGPLGLMTSNFETRNAGAATEMHSAKRA